MLNRDHRCADPGGGSAALVTKRSRPRPCGLGRSTITVDRGERSAASVGGGLDRVWCLLLAVADLDLAWLGLLRDRDSHREHPIVEVGFEGFQVEAIPELDLAPEVAPVTLGEVRLITFLTLPVALGGNSQHASFNGDVEAVGFTPGRSM